MKATTDSKTTLSIYWRTMFDQVFSGDVVAISEDGLFVTRTSPTLSSCFVAWNMLDEFNTFVVRRFVGGAQ